MYTCIGVDLILNEPHKNRQNSYTVIMKHGFVAVKQVQSLMINHMTTGSGVQFQIPVWSAISFVNVSDSWDLVFILSSVSMTREPGIYVVLTLSLVTRYFLLCSDEELFKQRKPGDKTVPQRGGEKDFSPDDSWLQAKRLEKFYEERRAVLAESRVERV